ncbi:MAG: family 20 glycosylhydrolase, partial [Planctomycetota bacterium]|nr:family 20 glycosylhydrolase [Planctomycetota bacterium]
AIIPAIETPGHHGAMARCYRDLFDGPGCMDMASEELYEGLDTVIGEMCSIFQSTPYIDVGCDECNWTGVGAGPSAAVYKRRHAVPRDAQSARNANEIYVVDMKRMADIGRKYGKLTIAWEDFPRDSRINKDIIAVLWYPHAVAQDWQREGWTTITAPWQLGVPFHEWNMYHCNGSTMQRTDRVLGVTGTMWQMSRLTVVNAWMNGANTGAERTWGPDTPIDYAEFEKRKAVATARATFLATPDELVASGGMIEGVDHYPSFRTIYGGERTFDLKAPIPGEIRYTSDFTEPTMASPVWAGPVKWKKNFILNAALFVEGKQIGSVSRHEYKWRDIEGYITNWDVAGPYVIEGKSGKDLCLPPREGRAGRQVASLQTQPRRAHPVDRVLRRLPGLLGRRPRGLSASGGLQPQGPGRSDLRRH